MPRYFPRPARAWIEDETWDAEPQAHIPTVSDHKATDTGLCDVNGDAIMRAPNPLGFIWDDE